jgi:hypothetical protein
MSKKTSAKKISGGLGLAALAAAAAATYYFSGGQGKKHRKQVENWAKTARGEMIEKIKGMKVVSHKSYHQAANEILTKYQQVKNIKHGELALFGAELKNHWDDIYNKASKLGAKNSPVKKSRKPSAKSPKK